MLDFPNSSTVVMNMNPAANFHVEIKDEKISQKSEAQIESGIRDI